MRRLLGVDVDLTVVATDQGWLDWLNERCSKYDPGMWKYFDCSSKLKLPYNLGQLFPQVEDPYQYWRELDYSQFKPIEGSVEALEKLSQYFGIVFISRIKGNHTKSKYYWLKEHFPFMTEYVATHGKWVMNNSVVAMVDDRLDVLKGFDFNKRIWFNTPYTQSVECDVAIDFSVWDDEIVKRICNEYL